MFKTYEQVFERRANTYRMAMTQWPDARVAEFKSMIEPFLAMSPGLVCDLPAGGGYLQTHLPADFDYVAVESTDGFYDDDERCFFKRISSPIDNVELASGSVDYLVSLAGLHHEKDLGRIFSEMHRLLKEGGIAVISDVTDSTGPAKFLNGFVDQHNPQGHEGHFFDDGTDPLLVEAGFSILADEIVSVPWRFTSRHQAGLFCRDLFGLGNTSPDRVAHGLDRDVGFDQIGLSVDLQWTLRRLVCQKPLTR